MSGIIQEVKSSKMGSIVVAVCETLKRSLSRIGLLNMISKRDYTRVSLHDKIMFSLDYIQQPA